MIAAGERRSIEFKSGGPLSDKHLVARVTRAVLAMTNTRDGGKVVIGVEEAAGVPTGTGLSASDLASWKFDDVAAKLAAYAEPYVNLEMEIVPLAGSSCVVLTVSEFDEVPVICKKAFDMPAPVRSVLRRGALYIRGRPKPESIEVSNQADMRELIDFATEKQLARFVRQGLAAGVFAVAGLPMKPSDEELFRRERSEFPG